jgi:menaquinone-dependent protoporphyrinogen oxidase
MLAAALRRRRFDVEVRPAATVDDLEGYDGAIVGGALYNNSWHLEATDLVDRFRGPLRVLPVWLFSSGPLDESANSGALAPIPPVAAVAKQLDVRGHMTFGGVLTNRPSGFIGGLLAYGPEGDFRDPHQIEQWADRIVAQISEPRSTVVIPNLDDSAAGRRSRIRRLLSVEEVDDDAGLDVLL